MKRRSACGSLASFPLTLLLLGGGGLLGGGCGSGVSAPPATSSSAASAVSAPGTSIPPGAAATPAAELAAAPSAAGSPLAEPPAPLSPRARAFLEAARAATSDPSAASWLEASRAALDSGGSVAPPAGPVPSVVARAAVALRAWAQSGEPVSLGESNEDSGLILRASVLSFALISTIQRSDEPLVGELLRLGQALRAPSNVPAALAIGSTLSSRLAEHVLGHRRQPVTEAFRTYAIADDMALLAGRAALAGSLRLARMISRESLAEEHAASRKPRGSRSEADPSENGAEAQVRIARQQRNLPVTGDWLSDELNRYAAFWNETEREAAAARTAPELADLIEQRLAAAKAHPSSMLVRLVADMVLPASARNIMSKMEELTGSYRASIAGKK